MILADLKQRRRKYNNMKISSYLHQILLHQYPLHPFYPTIYSYREEDMERTKHQNEHFPTYLDFLES